MLLTQKYAPKKLDEIVGNIEKIPQIRQWILHWLSGKKRKALLIHGPPGIGKTSIAYTLKEEYKLEIIEMNASEIRDKKRIEKTTLGASMALGLFGNLRIVLFDDADILAGRADSGGGTAILNFLKECLCPIIVTATDIWDKKMVGLRNECEIVEFKKINKIAVRKALERIANQEKLEIKKEQIDAIAENAQGDLRAAITDMQANNIISRDKEKDIFELVRKIFKTEKYVEIKKIMSGDVDYEIIKLWIDENIPNEYETVADISNAYDVLSKADVFDGRIRRNYWQLLKYSIDLSTAGVAAAKKQVYRKFTKYAFPTYLRNMARTVELRNIRKNTGLKIGKIVHSNRREALEYLPLIKWLAEKNLKNLDEISLFYNFSEEEMAFIIETSLNKVKSKSVRISKSQSS